MGCACNDATSHGYPAIPAVSGVCPCVLIQEARTWVGTPWAHQGRRKYVGVDCLGVVIESLRSVGALSSEYDLSDFARADYARNPRGQELLVTIQKHCGRFASPLAGALLVFKFGKAYRHVGLYLGTPPGADGPRLLHADATLGVRRVVEVGYTQNWVRFTEGAYALPGIAYEVQE